MTGKFSEGYAFIVEGETDRLFYELLMGFLCAKHSAEETLREDNASLTTDP